ncbi:hypothetical protein J3A83DRAFT_2927061 [Scleroderma citrinum]
MRRENDDHNAVFACQVVSARHAKLILSDSGQVYIVDLHSRHGTHLSRAGEAPKALKAEVETALADGDVLTFGKAVGAGSCMVLPVTTRVELLREKPVPSVSPSIPSLTPISSLVNLISRPSRNNSGRYGLFFPPPHGDDSPSPHSPSSLYVSSDGGSSVSDDHDSDIEEISVSSLERRYPPHVKIPTFRSFIHSMCRNNVGPRPSSTKDTLHTLEDFLVSPSPSLEEVRAVSPVVAVIGSAPNSRFHSPMELSTPSPSPPSLPSPPAKEHHSEPAVVGAWPTSRPESPDTPIETEVEKDDVVNVTAEETAVPEPVQGRESCVLPDIHHNFMDLPPPPFFPIGPPFRGLTSPFSCPPHVPSCLPGATNLSSERIGSELKTSIKIMEDRISAMQETITDLKTRQCFTEEDVMDLQTHVDLLEPESDRFLSRLNLAERNIASLSTVQSQVNALKSKLDSPDPKPIEMPMNVIKVCADALNSLVAEMKSLREGAEKRIDEKIEAIDAARTDTLNVIAAEVENLRSLKRKRGEENEDVEEKATKDEVEKPVDVVMSEICDNSVRQTKRAKTAMGTVAQTAAAMAMGAVVTWSALAYA